MEHWLAHRVISRDAAVAALVCWQDAIRVFVDEFQSSLPPRYPVTFIEVTNGRYVRMGPSMDAFDVVRGQRVSLSDTSLMRELPLYSHSVCLTGLMLQLHGTTTCRSQE